MYEFTNHNVPGSVGEPCYTAFYEGTVSTKLQRQNGTYAPIEEWDLTTDIPNPKAPDIELFFNKFANDNYIKIIKVTKYPKTPEQLIKLNHALRDARHLNIRLIIPKQHYPTILRMNIDNDYSSSTSETLSS